MKKTTKKILSMLLSISMILASVPGTALGESAKRLFPDGELPMLLKSERKWDNDPPERYARGTFQLASAANAAIASSSNAWEVKASDSNALEVSIGESGNQEGAYLLNAEWVEEIKIPEFQTSVKENVELDADGKIFKGQVEIRRNWLRFNHYNPFTNVSKYKITPLNNSRYTGDGTLTAKIYDGFDSDVNLDKVAASFEKGYNQTLTLDFSGLSKEETHEMRIEVYGGESLIGYCYFTLPLAPGLMINGKDCGNEKVGEYLQNLSDSEKAAIKSFEISDGGLDSNDWASLGRLTNLETLTVGANVNTQYYVLPGGSFKNHPSIKHVSLNQGGKTRVTDFPLTTIAVSAFEGCESLEEVDAPGVTNIYSDAFKGCTALKRLQIPDTTNIGTGAFENCTSLTDVELTKVTTIENRAFSGCSSLKSVSIPSIYSIGNEVFKGCINFKRIILSNDHIATYLDGNSFEGVPLPLDYSILGADGEALTGSDLQNALEWLIGWEDKWIPVLGYEAQVNRDFCVSYQLGETPKHYDGGSLKDCLDQIENPEAVTAFHVNRGTMTTEDWKALERLKNVRSLKLFDSIRIQDEIPSDWKPAKTLEELLIWNITEIPSRMFKDCHQMERAGFPESLKKIGDSAFENCEKLTLLVLPATPPALGKDVFKGCTGKGKSILTNSSYDDSLYRSSEETQWEIWLSGTPTPVPTPEPSGSSSKGGSNNESGKWVLDGRGWWFQRDNGYYPYSQWCELPYNGKYEWYYFDKDGYMITGWFTDQKGNTYYLHPAADGTRGHMYTGWNLIEGKWYYFSTEAGGMRGVLLKNTVTPDGYAVDAEGVWIP